MDYGQPQKVGLDYTVEDFATFYNLICGERGFGFPPHMGPICRGLLDKRIPKYMCVIGPGSGKSTAISEVFPAFELGHDPADTILGISAGEALMQGFQQSVMETIEWSKIYRSIFPKTKPDKAAGWSTQRGMFVTGREIGNPDASFAAAGLDSKRLTGLHAKLIICDDLHDSENSSTIEQCEKVWARWFNTILGRADPRGARYIVAGRRWNTEDIYSRLAKTDEWVIVELPAERANTKDLWVDITVPDGTVCCFNEKGIEAGSEQVYPDEPEPNRTTRRMKLSDIQALPPPRRPRLRLSEGAVA